MAQVVSCQSVPEDAWFNPRSVITAFIMDIVAMEQVFRFLCMYNFCLYQYYSTNAP